MTRIRMKKTRGVWAYVSLFWLAFLIGIASIFLLFYGVANFSLLGAIPDVRELENPQINIPSEIYSSDGVLLDKFEIEKRIPIEFEDLPPYLVDALISKEDERFMEHSGIDQIALLRILRSGGSLGGGSTVTQQLAKLLFSEKPKNKFDRIKQKLKEWVVAVKLEKLYTKQEIITLYLNKFDFIYGASGVESASRTYFGKSVSDLTRPESAMIVAMLNNPVRFNPKKNPRLAYSARNRVLAKMFELGKVSSEEEFRKDTVGLVKLNFSRQVYSLQSNLKPGYYKYALKKEIRSYLKGLEEKTGKKYSLYSDGLKIQLTIDSRLQKGAEDAVTKHMKVVQKQFFNEHKYRKKAPFYYISDKTIERILVSAMRRSSRYKTLKENGLNDDAIRKNFDKPTNLKIFTWKGGKDTIMSPWDSIRYHKHILRSGLMSMDPKTGMIKAWVGGIDYNFFKYDHVSMGRRQVGSTFKPIVYATAIDQVGYTPCHEVSNERFNVGGWQPRNSNGKYGGKLSLRMALAHSVNVVSARLIAETKPKAVIETARMMGITSPIRDNYTIALGSTDVTLSEMVGAYSTFANGGFFIKPELILRIEDKNGEVIKEYEPKTEEVFNEKVAYTMVDLLRGVTSFGTAKKVRSYFNSDIAGKTGTTNDNSDGWFIGMVPNLVTGVWVGAEDRAAHFRSSAYGQGAYMALPIWVKYMQSVYKNGKKVGVSPSDKFLQPGNMDEKWSCKSLLGMHLDDLLADENMYFEKTNTKTGSLKPNQIKNANDKAFSEEEIDFNMD